MFHRVGCWFALTFFLLLAPGCGGQREWEVTVENKGDVPCSFFVTMRTDRSSKANVDDVAKGQAVKLIGGRGENIVRTVKVVRGKEEHVLTPDAKLVDGKRFAIVVDADGKVATSLLDK